MSDSDQIVLTFTVAYKGTMTLDAVRECDAALREFCAVEETTDGRRCTVELGVLCSEMGDHGPDEWARSAVGFPECPHGDAYRLLEAAALEAWWDDLRDRLERQGAIAYLPEQEASPVA